jgi:hypothetical protein
VTKYEDNNVDLEWENDPSKMIITKEVIQQRKRYNFSSKQEIFLCGYETIFSWLDINYNFKEQFWETIQYLIANGQENLFEIRIIQIMEFEVRERTFRWWNEHSRNAKRKRTLDFRGDIFVNREEKMLTRGMHFLKTWKMKLK